MRKGSSSAYLAAHATILGTLFCGAACSGDDDDANAAAGGPSGYVCIFTEESEFECVDSEGSNPAADKCSDKYASLGACQSDNESAQETNGSGAEMCIYTRTSSNFRWMPGPCPGSSGASSSSSSTSSSSSSGGTD